MQLIKKILLFITNFFSSLFNKTAVEEPAIEPVQEEAIVETPQLEEEEELEDEDYYNELDQEDYELEADDQQDNEQNLQSNKENINYKNSIEDDDDEFFDMITCVNMMTKSKIKRLDINDFKK